MNELVERLTKGPHKIAAERSKTPQELKEQIEREFVLLKFTETRGGTELGSQLDMELTQLGDADFERGSGVVHLVGNLTLNYDKVQLVADIDLSSLTGKGHLVLLEEEIDRKKTQAGASAASEQKRKAAATDGVTKTSAGSASAGKASRSPGAKNVPAARKAPSGKASAAKGKTTRH